MHEEVGGAAAATAGSGTERPPLADPVQDKFALIDKDHDGKASVAELTSYIEDKKNEVARVSGRGAAPDAQSEQDYAYLRRTYMYVYNASHPGSAVTDIKDMVLTEDQTADLQANMPRYRSDELSGKDQMFKIGSDNDRAQNKSTEPEFDFKQLAGGKSAMTFDDFVAAVKSHNHYTAQDQASLLVKRGNQAIDTSSAPKELAFDANGSIDFDHFKSIYETSPILRDNLYISPDTKRTDAAPAAPSAPAPAEGSMTVPQSASVEQASGARPSGA